MDVFSSMTIENSSPSNECYFILQGDGNAVIYYNNGSKNPRWKTKTEGSGASRIELRDDGFVMLLRDDGS